VCFIAPLFENSQSMEPNVAKAAGLSGVCTERAGNGTTSRAALPRKGRFACITRARPPVGAPADVQAAGHTPGKPVALARSDVFETRAALASAGITPQFESAHAGRQQKH
jgi:hypothetical protein